VVVVVVVTGRVVVVVDSAQLVVVTASPGPAPVVGDAVCSVEQPVSNTTDPTSRVPAARHRRLIITKTITVERTYLVPRSSRSPSERPLARISRERLTEETFGYVGSHPHQGDLPRR